MKRVFTLVLLTTFAAGPTLMWPCEHPCAKPVVEKAASDCHGSGAAGLKFVDDHDCGQHVIETAPAVNGTRPELRPTDALAVVFAECGAMSPSVNVTAGAPPSATGPPIPPFSLPLRI